MVQRNSINRNGQVQLSKSRSINCLTYGQWDLVPYSEQYGFDWGIKTIDSKDTPFFIELNADRYLAKG